MKKFLFLIIAILFCKDTIADPPYNIHSAAKGNDVEHEAFVQKLISDPFARSHFDSNKGYKSYLNRKQQENQAYLDAKTSAEISVDETTGITTIKWNDGAAYQGQTYYGEIKGVGTMVYPDGSKYVGLWERDLPNGNGTFQTPEGITFTTTFENGLPHGKGVIQDLDGRKYTARWKDGKLKEKSIKPLEE